MIAAIVAGAVAALRIISLAPNLTEDLYAIGAGPHVVAVDAYSDRPAAAKALPHVGALRSVNAESILALHPDLVVGVAYQGPVILQLSRLGITARSIQTDTLADDFAAIQSLGRLSGHAPAASLLVRSLQRRIAAASRATAHLPMPRVLVVVDVQPIYTAGAGSYINDLLKVAHVANVAGMLRSPFPNISAELVERQNPDIIITTPNMRIPLNLPPWSRLRAVRERRIVRLSEADLFRAGPHVADVLDALLLAISPYRAGVVSERPAVTPGEVRENVHRVSRRAAPASSLGRRRPG